METAAACTASAHTIGATRDRMSLQLVCTNSISHLAVHVMTNIQQTQCQQVSPKSTHGMSDQHAKALLFSSKA